MRDLVTALGLVLAIEGLIYAANPQAMKRIMAMVLEVSGKAMRIGGFIAFAVGFLIVWLARVGL